MKGGKLKRILLRFWDWYSVNKRVHAIRKKCPIDIMTSEETIAYILKNHCSIARYGDGDMGLMMKTEDEGYQKISDSLANALQDVFANTSKNLLICMPYPLVSTKAFKKHGQAFWKEWAIKHQERVMKIIKDKNQGIKYKFGDSFVSRPVTGYKSSKKTRTLFPLLKKLWDNRDVIIVEGEKTRMGIGNDLFDNTRSIKRVLCPAENAFDVYPQILKTCIENNHGELVLMALGPTATVLASDLSKQGIQALDLGHIDIQYEWYLSGREFQPVKDKYTNESIGGNVVADCKDENYLSQIIAKI